PKSRAMRLDEFDVALRAYRQLATELRSRGLVTVGDWFGYRARVVQRQVLRRRGQLFAYSGNVLLDLLAGYGYKPLRSLLTYVCVIIGFAAIYYLLRNSVHPILSPLDSLIFSITSFHGRGFSPGESVSLHNPLTIVAAGEAIFGLLIEITFIATFTQRFFAR